MDRTIAEKQVFEDREGELWAVFSVVPAANQIGLRSAKGIQRIERIHDFQRRIMEDDVKLVSGTASSEPPTPSNVLELNLTLLQREGLDRRKRVVDYLQRGLATGKTWDEVENELHDKADVYGDIPCRRTLMRWNDAQKKGRLHPGKPGWRTGRRRIEDEVISTLERVIEKHRASGTREQQSLSSLKDDVDAELRKLADDTQRPLTISHKTLKAQLAQREAWGVDMRSLLNRSSFRAATRVAQKTVDATRPLELVEIDALIPEFHIFTPDGECIGQPTIYAAIDVATGIVLGIKAYMMKPGVEPLLDFLEHMFFDKPPRRNGWLPPWGRIELLISDQGVEFLSSFAAGVAYTMGYQHLYAEGEAGWKKPHIERFFGILKNDLLHRIAGSTKSAVNVNGQIDPDLALRTGGITLENLNAVLWHYAWDIHAHRESDRLRLKFKDADMTPARAWDTLIKEYPPMLPIPREDFRKSTYEFIATRKLDHDGVRLDGLDYHSDTLAALYKEIGPNTVEVYGSPLDAGSIHIKTKASGQSAEALSKQTQAHGLPRRVWKTLKKQLRLGKKSANDHEIAVALSRLREQTTAQAVGKKVRPKRRAAATSQSLSQNLSTQPDEASQQVSTGVSNRPLPDTVPGRTPIVPFKPKKGNS